jgi:hypothetical protein
VIQRGLRQVAQHLLRETELCSCFQSVSHAGILEIAKL